MAVKFPKEGGSSKAKPMVNLQDLMKKLIFKDDELDDVVLLKEDVDNLREGGCCQGSYNKALWQPTFF
jgi:hypothetical protein